jgi:ketosteroid isomerase-like protein
MDFRRCVILTIISGFILVFVATPATASEHTVVLATVHQFVDGLNRGDMKTVLATCASPAVIIDDFSPHEWHGPTACADWLSAFDAENKKDGITDGLVTLRAPWHVSVTGDRGYVVVPANYTYKQRGKPVTESGSILTVALKKVAASWRITGWSWAMH